MAHENFVTDISRVHPAEVYRVWGEWPGEDRARSPEFQAWFTSGLRHCLAHAYPVQWHVANHDSCPRCSGAWDRPRSVNVCVPLTKTKTKKRDRG